MLINLYLQLIAKGYNFIKKIYYGGKARGKFFSGGLDYRHRDQMTADWAKSFEKYLINTENSESFLSNLDEKGKSIAMRTLHNIDLINRNNFIPYSQLFDQDLADDQKEYANFVFNQPKDYFKQFEHLSFINKYYLSKFTYDVANTSQEGVILDCGAFIGDTAIPLAYKYPETQIYAFEPEINNYQRLVENIEHHQLQNRIHPIQLGVGDTNTSTTISNGGAGAKVGEGEQQIDIVTIDSFVDEHNLKVRLIKWDIEGFEYESIIGTEATIKSQKPVLIISLYHRGKDFFEIIELLKKWNVGYKYTVRKWNCFHPFGDTILICY